MNPKDKIAEIRAHLWQASNDINEVKQKFNKRLIDLKFIDQALCTIVDLMVTLEKISEQVEVNAINNH